MRISRQLIIVLIFMLWTPVQGGNKRRKAESQSQTVTSQSSSTTSAPAHHIIENEAYRMQQEALRRQQGQVASISEGAEGLGRAKRKRSSDDEAFVRDDSELAGEERPMSQAKKPQQHRRQRKMDKSAGSKFMGDRLTRAERAERRNQMKQNVNASYGLDRVNVVEQPPPGPQTSSPQVKSAMNLADTSESHDLKDSGKNSDMEEEPTFLHRNYSNDVSTGPNHFINSPISDLECIIHDEDEGDELVESSMPLDSETTPRSPSHPETVNREVTNIIVPAIYLGNPLASLEDGSDSDYNVLSADESIPRSLSLDPGPSTSIRPFSHVETLDMDLSDDNDVVEEAQQTLESIETDRAKSNEDQLSTHKVPQTAISLGDPEISDSTPSDIEYETSQSQIRSLSNVQPESKVEYSAPVIDFDDPQGSSDELGEESNIALKEPPEAMNRSQSIDPVSNQPLHSNSAPTIPLSLDIVFSDGGHSDVNEGDEPLAARSLSDSVGITPVNLSSDVPLPGIVSEDDIESFEEANTVPTDILNIERSRSVVSIREIAQGHPLPPLRLGDVTPDIDDNSDIEPLNTQERSISRDAQIAPEFNILKAEIEMGSGDSSDIIEENPSIDDSFDVPRNQSLASEATARIPLAHPINLEISLQEDIPSEVENNQQSHDTLRSISTTDPTLTLAFPEATLPLLLQDDAEDDMNVVENREILGELAGYQRHRSVIEDRTIRSEPGGPHSIVFGLPFSDSGNMSDCVPVSLGSSERRTSSSQEVTTRQVNADVIIADLCFDDNEEDIVAADSPRVDDEIPKSPRSRSADVPTPSTSLESESRTHPIILQANQTTIDSGNTSSTEEMDDNAASTVRRHSSLESNAGLSTVRPDVIALNLADEEDQVMEAPQPVPEIFGARNRSVGDVNTFPGQQPTHGRTPLSEDSRAHAINSTPAQRPRTTSSTEVLRQAANLDVAMDDVMAEPRGQTPTGITMPRSPQVIVEDKTMPDVYQASSDSTPLHEPMAVEEIHLNNMVADHGVDPMITEETPNQNASHRRGVRSPQPEYPGDLEEPMKDTETRKRRRSSSASAVHREQVKRARRSAQSPQTEYPGDLEGAMRDTETRKRRRSSSSSALHREQVKRARRSAQSPQTEYPGDLEEPMRHTEQKAKNTTRRTNERLRKNQRTVKSPEREYHGLEEPMRPTGEGGHKSTNPSRRVAKLPEADYHSLEEPMSETPVTLSTPANGSSGETAEKKPVFSFKVSTNLDMPGPEPEGPSHSVTETPKKTSKGTVKTPKTKPPLDETGLRAGEIHTQEPKVHRLVRSKVKIPESKPVATETIQNRKKDRATISDDGHGNILETELPVPEAQRIQKTKVDVPPVQPILFTDLPKPQKATLMEIISSSSSESSEDEPVTPVQSTSEAETNLSEDQGDSSTSDLEDSTDGSHEEQDEEVDLDSLISSDDEVLTDEVKKRLKLRVEGLIGGEARGDSSNFQRPPWNHLFWIVTTVGILFGVIPTIYIIRIVWIKYGESNNVRLPAQSAFMPSV